MKIVTVSLAAVAALALCAPQSAHAQFKLRNPLKDVSDLKDKVSNDPRASMNETFKCVRQAQDAHKTKDWNRAAAQMDKAVETLESAIQKGKDKLNSSLPGNLVGNGIAMPEGGADALLVKLRARQAEYRELAGRPLFKDPQIMQDVAASVDRMSAEMTKRVAGATAPITQLEEAVRQREIAIARLEAVFTRTPSLKLRPLSGGMSGDALLGQLRTDLVARESELRAAMEQVKNKPKS